MVGRDLRSRLHLLKPDLRGTVLKAATRQVMTRTAATERLFYPGEKVLVQDYRLGRVCWQPAVVEEKAGTKTYVGLSDHGERWRRHSDQMKSNPCGIRTSAVEENELDGDVARTLTAGDVETARERVAIGEFTSPLPRPVDQCEGPGPVLETVVAPPTMEGGETNPEPPHLTGSDLQPSNMLPTGAQSVGSTEPPQLAGIVKTRSGRVCQKPDRYADPGF